jgi:hypothetical protein
MKEEKEVIWLMKLYNCQYIKGGLFKSPKLGCIKDFERLLNAPENDKNFNEWIKKIKLLKIIESNEKIKIGGIKEVDGYFVNKKEIINRLRELDIYLNILYPFFNSRVEVGGLPK